MTTGARTGGGDAPRTFAHPLSPGGDPLPLIFMDFWNIFPTSSGRSPTSPAWRGFTGPCCRPASAGNAGWEVYCFLLCAAVGWWGRRGLSAGTRYCPSTRGGVGNGPFSSVLLCLLQEKEANKGNNCSLWPLRGPLAVEADLRLWSACFGARTDAEKYPIKDIHRAVSPQVPIMVPFLPSLGTSALKT